MVILRVRVRTVLVVLWVVFAATYLSVSSAKGQFIPRHQDDCACTECQHDHHSRMLEHYEQRTENMTERGELRQERQQASWEAHLARADARPFWDVFGKWNDKRKAEEDLQRARDQAREQMERDRQMALQHHLYERQRNSQRRYGRAVMDTEWGARIENDFEALELEIDWKELEREAVKRRKEKEREDQQEQRESLADEQRRDYLAETGKRCLACQKSLCKCKRREPQRQPQEELKELDIPVVWRGMVKMRVGDSGYRRTQMMRLPPREPQREPQMKGPPEQKSWEHSSLPPVGDDVTNRRLVPGQDSTTPSVLVEPTGHWPPSSSR